MSYSHAIITWSVLAANQRLMDLMMRWMETMHTRDTRTTPNCGGSDFLHNNYCCPPSHPLSLYMSPYGPPRPPPYLPLPPPRASSLPAQPATFAHHPAFSPPAMAPDNFAFDLETQHHLQYMALNSQRQFGPPPQLPHSLFFPPSYQPPYPASLGAVGPLGVPALPSVRSSGIPPSFMPPSQLVPPSFMLPSQVPPWPSNPQPSYPACVSNSGSAPYGTESSPTLWRFLLDLLMDGQHSAIIRWTDFQHGIFKFEDAEEVARLWGEQKNNRRVMNYEKLSRALRYYYHKGILKKVSGQRFSYRFVLRPDAENHSSLTGQHNHRCSSSASSSTVRTSPETRNTSIMSSTSSSETRSGGAGPTPHRSGSLRMQARPLNRRKRRNQTPPEPANGSVSCLRPPKKP